MEKTPVNAVTYFAGHANVQWYSIKETRSKAADLILDECANGIGKLIQIADAGEISPVDGMCGRHIVVISCKNADDSDLTVQQRTYFGSGIQDAIVSGIMHIMPVQTELDNVVGTGIG